MPNNGGRYFSAARKYTSCGIWKQGFKKDSRKMTALEDGIAKSASLRSVEVCAPVSLYARIEHANGDTDKIRDALEVSVGLIRSLGAGRNRGFGRVSVAFTETSG